MFKDFWSFCRKINRKYFFDYFLVFTIALVLFSWLQASPTLPEPDSFYHAKVATFLSEGEILHQFPWLQETDLKNNYVDHHFLYHLLLVPFVKITDPLIGVKLATVFFASLLVLIIYWIFKKFQIKAPFLFIIFLLVSQPWLFRASLVKAPAVFLIFFLLAFYFLTHQKWLWLTLISFFSVWLYGGWPLILLMAIAYVFISWILEKLKLEESIWFKIKNVFRVKKKTIFYQGFGYVILGLAGGIIINPYFPQNLDFYWQQIVKIALVNYQNIIGVGGEWYPYGFWNLISDAPLACALLVISILLFILTFRKSSIYSWVWAVLAIIFLVFTLKSRRNIEFFIPIVIFFSAFSFSDYLKKLSRFRLGVLMNIGWQAFFGIIFLVLGAVFILQIPSDLIAVKKDMQGGWNLSHYQKSAEWLRLNTPPGTIVFNADWDDFPSLFYHNSHNLYLTGLDPTFMFENDRNKYWLYVDVSLGKQYQQLKQIVKEDFKADYIFLDKQHVDLNRLLRYHLDFEKVYEDSEAIIYQVI